MADMKPSVIQKTVVNALNEMFDAQPEAFTEILSRGSHPSLLDIANGILDALAPGKTVNMIVDSRGVIDGFVLGRSVTTVGEEQLPDSEQRPASPDTDSQLPQNQGAELP